MRAVMKEWRGGVVKDKIEKIESEQKKSRRHSTVFFLLVLSLALNYDAFCVVVIRALLNCACIFSRTETD